MPVESCDDVPVQKCEDVPSEVCEDVETEVCHDGVSEAQTAMGVGAHGEGLPEQAGQILDQACSILYY